MTLFTYLSGAIKYAGGFVIAYLLTALFSSALGPYAWVLMVAWACWVGWGIYKHFYMGVSVQGSVNDVDENFETLNKLVTPYVMAIKEAVFLGRTPGQRKPIDVTISPEVFHKNHVSILGASGTGKSKIAALILSQLHASGDSVVVFDPKDDEFLPGILNEAAKASGKPFLYINLREDVPQINPLAGATRNEIETLLQSALNLDPTGDPGSDFYRGEDREGSTHLVETGGKSMAELLALGSKLKAVTDRTGLWREFRDLTRLEAFNTDDGRDLAGVINAGGVVYVVGDTDSLRIVAAQRMLLARVLQIIKNRSRDGANQVALMLDEFKYMLSNSSLRALGTIRDRRCNLLLAYQSYGDLADCGSLKAEAVLGAAKGNTTLKFVYKLEDADTAEQFSKMAGNIKTIEETSSKVEVDGVIGGVYRQGEKQAVSIDMLTTNLPKPRAGEASVGWVFGLGPAFPLSTMLLPKGEAPSVIQARKSAVVLPPTTAQALI